MKQVLCGFVLSCIISFSLAAQPLLKVSGEVTHPLQLSAADLARMPHVSASLKDRDGVDHHFTGIPVSVILDMAGVTTGKQLRGENLGKYMMVKCADGYEVLFSLAEMDSSFTDKLLVLADVSDGQPLPAGKGPLRLVAQGEKKPARSCFQVTELVVRFAKD